MEKRFQITPEDEVKKMYHKVGVMVFVFNEEEKVLLLRENMSNGSTGKEAGKYGVPCETSLEGEGWEETVIRVFREEIGMSDGDINKILKINPRNCFLGEGLFLPGVLARTCIVRWAGRDNQVFEFQGDGEVDIVGWEKLENFLSYPLRPGVENVLRQCLEERIFQKDDSEELIPISIAGLGMAIKET